MVSQGLIGQEVFHIPQRIDRVNYLDNERDQTPNNSTIFVLKIQLLWIVCKIITNKKKSSQRQQIQFSEFLFFY